MSKDIQFEMQGDIVDVVSGDIFFGRVIVKDGRIFGICKESAPQDGKTIMPGLVNAHGHVESSLLVPSQFARMAVIHGDVAGIYDPHELANVCGVDGVWFMINDAAKVPFKFCFGAPSCVPATNSFVETAGAELSAVEVIELLNSGKIGFLSEVMNAPAVINKDRKFISMIEAAKKLGLPVDGHCPAISGEELNAYIGAGISTDHECTTLSEALEKLNAGLKYILIREGSAAKNFEALHPLLTSHPDRVMFCSDDIHPHNLIDGHMNVLVKRAMLLGYNPIDVIRCVTLHPVKHYNLQVGLLQEGDCADFIVVDSLNTVNVINTFIDGKLVSANGRALFNVESDVTALNKFVERTVSLEDIKVRAIGDNIRVIGVTNGQLITTEEIVPATIKDGYVVSDLNRDMAKLVVVNRYDKETMPAVGFVRGLGIRKGAVASSVAHDCHQIVVAGVDDSAIVMAINAVMRQRGGLCIVSEDGSINDKSKNYKVDILGLPVGGIMTNEDAFEVAKKYKDLHAMTQSVGANVSDLFMALSFLALSVIGEIKLTDKGLFKIGDFSHVSLFA